MKKLIFIAISIFSIFSTLQAQENCRLQVSLSRDATNYKSRIYQAIREKGYVLNNNSDLILDLDAAIKFDGEKYSDGLFNNFDTFQFSMVEASLKKGDDLYFDEIKMGPNRLIKRVRDGQVIRHTTTYHPIVQNDLSDSIENMLSKLPHCK